MVKPLKVHGADVSHHQGRLDLKLAVDKGLEWLYHKVTEGSSFIDREYNKRREDALEAQLPFGAYHFARFNSLKDAKEEAKFFVERADPKVGDLLPVLDIETSEGNRLDQIRTFSKVFAAEVEQLTGFDVMFYTPYDLKLPGLYWRPRYNNENIPPTLNYDIWQFSNGTFGVPNSFPGLGRVDLNTFAEGRSLKDILIKKPQKEEEPKPPKPPKERPREEIKFLQSSMEMTDTKKEIIFDVHQMFNVAVNQDVDVISLSETDRRGPVMPYVRIEAEKRGWYLQDQFTSDCRFILNPKNKLIEDGYVHVLDGQGGLPKGNFTNRGVAEITFETVEGNIATAHTTHWLTAFELDKKPGPEHLRERKFDKQTDAVIERVLLHGLGRRLSFWMGDTNLDEQKDTGFDKDAIHFQFEKAGLVSIFDELMPDQELPNTMRSVTIDIIGRLLTDTRVRPERVKVYPLRGRNSNHQMVLAVYSVALPRK